MLNYFDYLNIKRLRIFKFHWTTNFYFESGSMFHIFIFYAQLQVVGDLFEINFMNQIVQMTQITTLNQTILKWEQCELFQPMQKPIKQTQKCNLWPQFNVFVANVNVQQIEKLTLHWIRMRLWLQRHNVISVKQESIANGLGSGKSYKLALIWAKTQYSWRKNHFFLLSLSFCVQSCHHQMQDSYAMHAVFKLWPNGLQEPYHYYNVQKNKTIIGSYT